MGCACLRQRCRRCCDSSLAAPVASSSPAGSRQEEGGFFMEGMRRGGLLWVGLFSTREFHCLVSGLARWNWGWRCLRSWREQRRAGGLEGKFGGSREEPAPPKHLQLGKMPTFFLLSNAYFKIFYPRKAVGWKGCWGDGSISVPELLRIYPC